LKIWSFVFVSDLGFRASDLVAAERSEASPSSFVVTFELFMYLFGQFFSFFYVFLLFYL
jgi:hypothetical protein